MMLVNESAPLNDSINSAILDQNKFVIYTSFFQLCQLLKRIGNRGWIWVVDAVDAYYRIPIQERFQHLFGIIWLGKLLIYKCLSFGLASAPSIYNKFADLILWTCTYWARNKFANKNFFNILHYLDDFFGGSHSKHIAQNQMNFLTFIFDYLNVPTNPSKVVGPSQTADILGWCCTTTPIVQIGLAERKRLKYISFLELILNNLVANFKQFEKLIGYTRHTCHIYIEGNKFVRGFEKQKYLIESKINKKSNSTTKFTKFHLSKESIFDLHIWLQLFTDIKNRFVNIDYILQPDSLPTINVYTDASTSYGAGGVSGTSQIYHLPWTSLPKTSKLFKKSFNLLPKEQIIYLELFALVLHAKLFAKHWSNKFIHFWTDNKTVEKIIKKGSINFKSLLYYPQANLVKILARLALKYNFHFTCSYIEGKKNVHADALSRKDPFARNSVYNYFQSHWFIPKKIASNLINCTCVPRFSTPFSI